MFLFPRPLSNSWCQLSYYAALKLPHLQSESFSVGNYTACTMHFNSKYCTLQLVFGAEMVVNPSLYVLIIGLQNPVACTQHVCLQTAVLCYSVFTFPPPILPYTRFSDTVRLSWSMEKNWRNQSSDRRVSHSCKTFRSERGQDVFNNTRCSKRSAG